VKVEMRATKMLYIAVTVAAVIGLAAPVRSRGDAAARPTVEKSIFGKLDDGTTIDLYTLKNDTGATAKIITYGATLMELWVPDRGGKAGDIVLGFDNLKDYEGPHPHFGGIIGRVANRIHRDRANRTRSKAPAHRPSPRPCVRRDETRCAAASG